jgi:hypothetical protein
MTTELQLEVEPVLSADLTLELAPANVRAQGNGVRASLSYPLGGGNTAVRYPVRCSISSPHPAPILSAFPSVVMYNPLLHGFFIHYISLRSSRSHLLNPPMTRKDFSGIRALVFDVIGTTTDWHSLVQQALEVVAAKRPDIPPKTGLNPPMSGVRGKVP